MTDDHEAARVHQQPAAGPATQDAQAAARRAALHAAAVLDRELRARSQPGLGTRLRRVLTLGRT